MSIWRSPVFYFGIVLLLAVAMLLLAPFVINWNGYKQNLEAYGQRLTGRDVTIDGNVAVRLFPWPRLTAIGVKLANPEGFSGPPLLVADKVTLSLELGGLLNGTLNVQSVDIQQPIVNLIRDGDGRVNWMLQSDEDLRKSALLSNVKLDQIRLVNGELHLEDRVRDFKTAFTTLDSEMSSQAIQGPWRFKGSGNWREMPLSFAFSSSAYEKSEPFRFGLRVMPGDSALPSFAVDGAWDGALFDGALRVSPQASEGQKSSFQGDLRPLALQARLKASPERADFTNIRIAPSDTKEGGTLIEGSGSIDFENQMRADFRLKSPRFDLDSVLGAESLTIWRAGGVLALANLLMQGIPEKLNAQFALDVTSLTVGGQALEAAQIEADVSRQGIGIKRARVGLPGRSAVMLTGGSMVRKDGAAELAGALSFESSDMRAFAGWAAPERKAGFEQWWKGNRGRIKLNSKLTWSQAQFALSAAEFELDGLPGTGDLAVRQGNVPALDLRLDMKSLDLDSFLPQGLAATKNGGAYGLLAMLEPLLRGGETLEKHIKLDAASVILNGAAAQDVAFDISTSQRGFEIKTFDIGSVSGARVKAEGLVLIGELGPTGDVTASLVADDPRGFLRLAGIADAESDWVNALGQTDISFKFNAKPGPAGAVLSYALNGASGPFSLALTGGIADIELGSDASLSLQGEVTTPDAGRFLTFFGLRQKADAAGGGKVSLDFSGSQSTGFAGNIEASAFGGRVSFAGSLKPEAPYSDATGQFNIFAEDVTPLFKSLGVPLTEGPGGALRLALKLTPDNGGLKITDIVGDYAGMALSGEAAFAANGRLQADFGLGSLNMMRMMAVAFTPWDGGAFDAARSFAGPDELLVNGEIWLRPQELELPFAGPIREAALGLMLDATRRMELRVPTRQDVDLNLSIAPKDGGFVVAADGRLPVDLARLARLSDGTALAGGNFNVVATLKAEGRSPAAVLAALEGRGSFAIENLSFTRIAPETFAASIPAAKTAEQLSAALTTLETSGELTVDRKLLEFEIAKGLLKASALRVATANTLSDVVVSSDFAEGRLDVATSITLNGRPDLPAVTVTYSGTPGAMERRTSSSALASKLGHEMLARDLAELERLKREQEKLAVAEEEQRQQDVAKFEAYQAQRAELRMRQRELKVFAAERARKQEIDQAQFAAFVAEGDAINRIELARRKAELGARAKIAAWTQENERRKREEEERQRLLNEKLKREEEARLKQIEDEKARTEALRLKALEDERARIEAARLKAEQDARIAEEARLKAEADAKALAEETARQDELRRKLQETEQKAKEEDARRKLDEVIRQNAPADPARPKPNCINPLYC